MVLKFSLAMAWCCSPDCAGVNAPCVHDDAQNTAARMRPIAKKPQPCRVRRPRSHVSGEGSKKPLEMSCANMSGGAASFEWFCAGGAAGFAPSPAGHWYRHTSRLPSWSRTTSVACELRNLLQRAVLLRLVKCKQHVHPHQRVRAVKGLARFIWRPARRARNARVLSARSERASAFMPAGRPAGTS